MRRQRRGYSARFPALFGSVRMFDAWNEFEQAIPVVVIEVGMTTPFMISGQGSQCRDQCGKRHLCAQMTWKQNLGPILFVICLTLGFGPLIWGDWMLVHDNFNGFLPYRHFASAAFRNGQFPFWNPWINLGYPFASDPPKWCLVSHWSGCCPAFSVYTPRVIAIEWLMHLAIGGLGVVRWMHLWLGHSVRRALGVGQPPTRCADFSPGPPRFLPFRHRWCLVAVGVWVVSCSRQASESSTSCLPLGLSMAMLILGGYPSFALHSVVWILIAWGLSSAWRLRHASVTQVSLCAACAVACCRAWWPSLLCSGFLVGFLADAPLTEAASTRAWSKGSTKECGRPGAGRLCWCQRHMHLPSGWIQTDVSHVNGFLGWAPLLILAFGWRQLTKRERRLGTCVRCRCGGGGPRFKWRSSPFAGRGCARLQHVQAHGSVPCVCDAGRPHWRWQLSWTGG